MHTIRFDEEHITPAVLAKKLGKPIPAMIKELQNRGERGIFTPAIERGTVLAWGTARRTCEAAGFAAIDGYQKTQEANMTKQTRKNLEECGRFHKEHAKNIGRLPAEIFGNATMTKKAQIKEHLEFAKTIEQLLEKTKTKKRPEEVGMAV